MLGIRVGCEQTELVVDAGAGELEEDRLPCERGDNG